MRKHPAMPRKVFPNLITLVGLLLLIAMGTIACSGPAHCPGNASTGTYKPGKTASRKYKGKSNKKCPGTASTGTSKPKRKRKPEDGLFSKEMKKAMKAQEEQ